MANRKQLKILKQGVKAWNAWREENPDVKINLRGAKLDGLDLSGANFRQADIRGVSFRKTLLAQVDFTQAKGGDSILGVGGQSLLSLFSGGMASVLIVTTCLWYFFWLSNFLRDSRISLSFFACLIMLAILLIGGSILSIRKGEVMKLATLALVLTGSAIAVGLTTSLNGFDYVPQGSIIMVIVFVLLVCLVMSLTASAAVISATTVAFRNVATVLLVFFVVLLVAIVVSLTIVAAEADVTGLGATGVATIFLVVSFFIIVGYVGYRTRCEDPQFLLLRRIGLFTSTMFGTSFRQADLTGSIFDKAILKHSCLGSSILTGTSFKNAQSLQFARCNGTILDDRDIRELLVHGKGEGQSFKGKNLSGAYLVEAELCKTDLRETDLMQANLSRADITGAKLYGSARENWIINGICCGYVYWDEAGEQRTPSDREFRPGEFEELYKQLPTFEYIFEQGFTPLDPLIMDRVVRAINERHKEFKLDLINFDKRGQPHATFTVCQIDFIDVAKEQVNEVYEANRVPPKEQGQLMSAVMGLIENQSKSLDIIKQLGGDAMGDTYNIQGGQVGAVGKKAIATGNIFQQITPELSHLHQEMQNNAATPEQQAATQDVAKAKQAAQQGDEPTMQQHLKNGGQWALDCAQKVGTDVLIEYLKKLTTGM
ncbi:hypothetical protein KKHLCK_15750 [Candidatus Electrothrix laxa]